MKRILVAVIAAIVLLLGAASAHAAPILWGAWVDGDAYGPTYDDPPWDMAAQDVFEQHAGKRATLIHYGQAWRQGGVAQPFYPENAQAVANRGAVPFLDWSPWDGQAGGGSYQPTFRLSKIIRGDFDAYIRSWATGVKSWGGRIMVRPMHEMNGNWYPWSERANSNRAGEYAKAWRHIVSIADAAGATNIEWVWCPNVVYSGSIPLSGLYPGSAYVDWVGIDGYNWGSPWKWFYWVFADTMTQLDKIAPTKRIVIAETGSAESGGDKAIWIYDALLTARDGTFPRIGAIAWFNWDADGAPWRIESSPSAQAEFAASIANPDFATP